MTGPAPDKGPAYHKCLNKFHDLGDHRIGTVRNTSSHDYRAGDVVTMSLGSIDYTWKVQTPG